jgi:hypothetical protein
MDFKYEIGELVGCINANKTDVYAIMLISDIKYAEINGINGYFYSGNIVYISKRGNCIFPYSYPLSSSVRHVSQIVDLSSLIEKIDLEEIKSIFKKRESKTKEKP